MPPHLRPSRAAPAFREHDHDACAGDVLARADTLDREGKLRLTPVRRRALEILLEAHRALGAYEVLDRLASDGFGNRPPVAYRALEYLVEHGFAHRIRRLNAFAACMIPDEPHAPDFFICDSCNAVAELPGGDTRARLDDAAARIGFSVSRASVEATGICPACAEGAA